LPAQQAWVAQPSPAAPQPGPGPLPEPDGPGVPLELTEGSTQAPSSQIREPLQSASLLHSVPPSSLPLLLHPPIAVSASGIIEQSDPTPSTR
jgi:hypothetical protein